MQKRQEKNSYYRDNQQEKSGKGLLVAVLADNGKNYIPMPELDEIPKELFKVTQLYRNDGEQMNTRKLFGVDVNENPKRKLINTI